MSKLIRIIESDTNFILKDPLITANSGNIITRGGYAPLREAVVPENDIRYVENIQYVLGAQDISSLKSSYTGKLRESLDITYNIVDFAKSCIEGISSPCKKKSGTNPMIHITRNFIMANSLIGDCSVPNKFCGVKVYPDYMDGNEVDFLVLTTATSGECVILAVVYAETDGAVIFKLTEDDVPIPYFAITHYQSKIHAIRLDESKDAILESLSISILENLIGKTYATYDLIDEASIRDIARDVKHKVTRFDKNASSKIDDTVDYIKSSAKKALLPDSREDIIKDTMPATSKLLKQAIAVGAAWIINPALAAVTALTAVVLNRKVKRDARRRILSELREEMELVEEKIKDADSKGDNASKYQLMRLRNKLKTSIERIKYGDNFVDGRDSVE
ncbi:MAG: hypothetical protein ACRC0G_07860 [Fusobacteriaceae bacterium]